MSVYLKICLLKNTIHYATHNPQAKRCPICGNTLTVLDSKAVQGTAAVSSGGRHD